MSQSLMTRALPGFTRLPGAFRKSELPSDARDADLVLIPVGVADDGERLFTLFVRDETGRLRRRRTHAA